MLKQTCATLALAALAIATIASPARADGCSGRNHETATILGAIGGGLLGSAATDGKAGGIVVGAVIGGLAGNALARDIDCDDMPYVERSYSASFSGDLGKHYGWRNGPNRGYIVSSRQYGRNGEVCRDFTQVTYRRNRELVRHGTACRGEAEGWRIL